jgi:ABC-type Fe3+ transport system substrate-binding protein
MIYDTNLVNASQVPSTFDQFLDPVWKNKLVLVYPNDDDAIGYLFSLIIDRYGWAWFESLTQQNVRWVRGTGTPAALLNAGNSTSALSFTTNLINSTHLAQGSTSDPHVMWPQTGAIFATTPRPESAKLFMNWIMSDEYQSTVVAANGLPLTRTGVNTTISATDDVWTDQSVTVTEFGKFEVNREVVEQWRFQFETTLGTAQGPSPLSLGI